jgi:hypothetical protein
MEIRICRKCLIVDVDSNFTSRTRCKVCTREYNQARYKKHLVKTAKKEKRGKDPELIKSRKKEYYIANREEIKARSREYTAYRIKIDPVYKLWSHIRSWTCHALKRRKTVPKKLITILGADYTTIIRYLSDKYLARYGVEFGGFEKGIELHHMIPLLTATTEEEVIRLSHYTNLEILTKEDHMKEHGKAIGRRKYGYAGRDKRDP